MTIEKEAFTAAFSYYTEGHEAEAVQAGGILILVKRSGKRE